MLHIIFQKEDVNALSKSFNLDESLRGNVIQVKDDFSVGPVRYEFTEEEMNARKEWWRGVLANGDYNGLADDDEINDHKTIEDLKEILQNRNEENVWIWIAPNKHDVSGYYWTISQLKDFEGRVMVLWLNNLPFINEKGHIFYPKNLFEIPPREFIKAQKLARPVSTAEFEIDPDEWAKLCNENKTVRILEGHKKLVQHDDDFFDEELLKFITPDWQKVNKLIHNFLHKATHSTGDAYLLWRLKKLISGDRIDAQGEVKNMKDFEVKTKATI